MLLDTAVDIRGGMINDDVLLDGKSMQSSCPKFLQHQLELLPQKSISEKLLANGRLALFHAKISRSHTQISSFRPSRSDQLRTSTPQHRSLSTTRLSADQRTQSQPWRAQQIFPPSSILHLRTLRCCLRLNVTWDPRTCRFTWSHTCGRLVPTVLMSSTSQRPGNKPPPSYTSPEMQSQRCCTGMNFN
jgi:hypothetical protein